VFEKKSSKLNRKTPVHPPDRAVKVSDTKMTEKSQPSTLIEKAMYGDEATPELE